MKICRVCQEDCSSKARVRDPEGNYYCKSCLKERQAREEAGTARAAPRAAAPPGDPFAAEAAPASIEGGGGYGLAELMEDAAPPIEEGAMMCPECGNAIRAGAVLCMRCGYDPVKKKSMRTKVTVEREPNERKRTSSGTILLQSLFDESPILPLLAALILGGLLVAGMNDENMALAFFAIAGVIGTGIWIWGLVLMFMDSVAHALFGFICGFYWLYWVILQSENRALQWLTLISILGSFAGRAVLGFPETSP